MYISVPETQVFVTADEALGRTSAVLKFGWSKQSGAGKRCISASRKPFFVTVDGEHRSSTEASIELAPCMWQTPQVYPSSLHVSMTACMVHSCRSMLPDDISVVSGDMT